MAKETGTDGTIPAAYRWEALVKKQGIELKRFYNELLTHLGEETSGRILQIYTGARSNIDEPKNLEKIILNILWAYCFLAQMVSLQVILIYQAMK